MAIVWAVIACLVIWLVASSEARPSRSVVVTAAGSQPTLSARWAPLLTLAAIAAATWLTQKLVRGRPFEWLTFGVAACGAVALALIVTYYQYPSSNGGGPQSQPFNRNESLRAVGLFLLLGMAGLLTNTMAAIVLFWGAALGAALALMVARERR